MSDIVSTAPAIYLALYGLIRDAAAAQNPPAYVAAFELGQYEPAAYIMVTGIENHVFEWEYVGYTTRETYDVAGIATVYSGASPVDNPTQVSTVLAQTYTLFQACVMVPVVLNRAAPVLGNTYQDPGAVNIMVPGYARYKGMPGNLGGGQSGWSGAIDWSFHFEALITVSP